jgi:hypothetical protein
MSFSLEPNKGLRLKLGRFTPIHTWQGGGNFWSHEFQLTVRQGALAAFLPRAIEDEDSVLFEYRSGGAEQAGASTAIASMSDIPSRELQGLRDAVNELKRKAEDPHCDRTKRQMIEGFRLPDPQKDRDLYRLIGKGASAKLIVLWGVEREEGSALAPGAAVDLMHTPGSETPSPVAATAQRSKLTPVLLLLAIALIAAGTLYVWQEKEKQRLAEQTAAADAASRAEMERTAAFNALASVGSTAPPVVDPSDRFPAAGSELKAQPGVPDAALAEPPPPEGTVVENDKGLVAGVMDKDGKVVPAEPGTSLDKDGKVTTPAKLGEVLKDQKGAITGVVDKDGKIAAVAPGKMVEAHPGEPVTGDPGTLVRDSKGAVTGVLDKDGKVVGATPGTTSDKDGKITSARPGTVFRDGTHSVTGIAGMDGKVVPAKPGAVSEVGKRTVTSTGTSIAGTKPALAPGTVVRSSTGHVTGVVNKEGKIAPAAPGTPLDENGKAASGAPGNVLRDRTGAVTGVVDKDGKIALAVPGKIVEAEPGKPVTASVGTLVRDGSGVVSGVVGADGKVVSATPGTVLDKDNRIIAGVPGTVFRDNGSVVTGVVDTDGKIANATPGAVASDPFAVLPAGSSPSPAASLPLPASPSTSTSASAAVPAPAPPSVTTPMTTQGPPPVGISSLSVVSTSLSPVLANGNVEVLLNVVARNTSGVVVTPPPISGWKVDGQLQSKADGAAADGPVLPVSLTPGSHRISTVGRGVDGQPFQTDAEVVVTPKA